MQLTMVVRDTYGENSIDRGVIVVDQLLKIVSMHYGHALPFPRYGPPSLNCLRLKKIKLQLLL
jgi:hypothetical protein